MSLLVWFGRASTYWLSRFVDALGLAVCWVGVRYGRLRSRYHVAQGHFPPFFGPDWFDYATQKLLSDSILLLQLSVKIGFTDGCRCSSCAHNGAMIDLLSLRLEYLDDRFQAWRDHARVCRVADLLSKPRPATPQILSMPESEYIGAVKWRKYINK